MNHYRIFAMSLAVLLLGVSKAQESSESSSKETGVFLDKESSFVPSQVIDCEPGTLEGHWLSRKATSVLRVTQLEDNPPSWADKWQLSVESETAKITMDFEAVHGLFRIYGVDVDGDGQDEIAMEHGIGRGTSCYYEYLNVFRIQAGRFKELLEPEEKHGSNEFGKGLAFNGYNGVSATGVAWARGYYWTDVDGDGRKEIAARVVQNDSDDVLGEKNFSDYVESGYWEGTPPPSYKEWRAKGLREFKKTVPQRQVFILVTKTDRYEPMWKGVEKLDRLNAKKQKTQRR